MDEPAVSAKRLAVSMFGVTAFSVSGASGSLLTSHNPSLHFCLTGILIVSCNVFTLSWLFGSKVSAALLPDKSGEVTRFMASTS